MELDDLKKSWNALDEHLKRKELIKDEEISNLISNARNNIHAISRFNKKLRITSLIFILLILFNFVYEGVAPDIYYQVIFVFCIPAFAWDLYTAHYLDKTKIDEMPLVTVIARFNRYHNWIIKERVVGMIFMLIMAVTLFFLRQVWQHGIGMIVFFVLLWTVCCSLPLWIYHRNLGRIKEIKKNLNELKELNQEA